MAVSYEEALSNIRQYADEAQAVQLSLMDVDDDDPHLLKERLDRTVEALRERLQVQQSALERVAYTLALANAFSAECFWLFWARSAPLPQAEYS